MNQLAILIYAFSLHLLSLSGGQAKSQVTLQDNGYRNLVIAINSKIKEDQYPNLVERIQVVFQNASRFLYSATNQRAYFHDIRILIPQSWSDAVSYQPVQNEHYDISDVRINPSTDIPYTMRQTPCGEQGEYINLSPDYVTKDEIANEFGGEKAIVHEWAHYRWGVFDEYPSLQLPSATSDKKQNFYRSSNGKIEAVRCPLSITGVSQEEDGSECKFDNKYKLGRANDICTFKDSRDADGYSGSLMYKQYLPRITQFCEDADNPVGSNPRNIHNNEAENRQNKLCQHKSVWKVMLEHEDFAHGANEPSGSADPLPKFTLVKKFSSSLVLVLDVSGSMEGERLREMRQAARNLIFDQSQLGDGQQLAIVTFDDFGHLLAGLTTVNISTRHDLVDKLPTAAFGYTSIGAGVKLGLRVLQDSINGAAGSRMVVISDGEENLAPYIEDIMHLVTNASVRIYTIAIGSEASLNLEKLATATYGTGFFHTNDSNTLNEAFGEISQNDQDDSSEVAVDLFSAKITSWAADSFEDTVYIDSSIGRNTHLSFCYGLDEGIDVKLTSPSGEVIGKQSTQYTKDDQFGLVQIDIEENAEEGEWIFEVINLAAEDQHVTVSVKSQSRDGDEPIVVNAQWGLDDVKPPEDQILYVTVAKGDNPVINSDVEATVSMSSGDKIHLVLEDNGVGADINSNDGIYSNYFTDFQGSGRYSVQVNVQSMQGNETFIAFDSIVGFGAVIDPEFVTSDKTVDNTRTQRVSTGIFQRVSNGGSFICSSPDGCTGTKDVYPPSRISDLAAEDVNIATRTVQLTFTATGDDLTSGQASYYEIRMDNNFTQLYQDFEAGENITEAQIQAGNLSRPRPSGNYETFVVRVPEVGDFSYVFAVVAIDDEGNRSPCSNLAVSTARDYHKSTVPTPTARGDRKPSLHTSAKLDDRKTTLPHPWLAIGVTLIWVFIIFAIICIVVIAYRLFKKVHRGVEVPTDEQV